jgi:uncharacterized membrane protein YphA (DoxX/SURF4 family)
MCVRPNPLHDVLAFLSAPTWTTLAFWLLLAGSVVIAVAAWRTDATQRSVRHMGIWLIRIVVGAMWWQQSLWKIPPNFDGLLYWMQQMAEHASIELQGSLVQNLVLPNIALFGPLVYGVEVLIAVSLMLGLLTRLGAVLGLLMALNLWLGLYSAPNEWPWTYAFIVLLQLAFLIDPPGRSLGVDVLLRHRLRLSALFV